VERLVSGVPPAPSTGGAGGLPDLPREGRGLGVVSLGARGMEEIYGPDSAGRQLWGQGCAEVCRQFPR
jgi:hypothetical protein